MKKNLLIIIPTLNEDKNINKIYKKITNVNKKYFILFIDDNSDDESQQIIKILKKKNKRVKYIFREKKIGIGYAHVEGLKYASKNKFKYVCTMDSDGTHDPIYIKKMLNLLKKSDIVITNRFLIKKSLKGFGFFRILITKIRYYLVWFLLGSKLDGSGGFRIYDFNKTKIKDIIESKALDYNFLWQSIFLLERKKYKISEIPITLKKRTLGSSKMTLINLLYGVSELIKFFIKYKI
jgi:dolichol-phosphate mannosyltransferase